MNKNYKKIILGIVLILERRRQSIPVFSLPRQHWIRMYLLGLAGYLLANAVALRIPQAA